VPAASGGAAPAFSFGVPAPAQPERPKRKAVSQLGRLTGDVYVAGNGDCAQMGLGEDEDKMECAVPTKLASLAAERVTMLTCGGMHTVALAERGRLWSWGCNDDFALGRDGDESVPALVGGALEQARVVFVSAGDCHSAALLADGKVFSWGTYKDSNGYIGYAPSAVGKPLFKAESPMLVPGLESAHITSIASGSNHTLAVARGRPELYSWGCGEQGQLGRKTSKETRAAHLVPARPALTIGGDGVARVNGDVGGAARKIRVLNANFCAHVSKLQKTDAAGDWTDAMDEYLAHLRGLPAPSAAGGGVALEAVFGGSYHSFALGVDGSVYAFGLNNMGQLGLGKEDSQMHYDPVRVHALDGKGVCMLSGGEHHSIALTKSGDVYVFGRGDSNQLGLGDGVDLHAAPKLLAAVSGKGAHKVCCGSNQCAAVTDTGDLFTWGFGEMYQLCNGKMQDNKTPTLVASEFLGGLRVLDVGMGGQHTVVLARPDDN